MILEEMHTDEFLDTHVSDLTAQKAFEREHGGIDRMALNGAEVANGRLYVTYKVYPTYTKTSTQYHALSGMSFATKYYDTSVSFVPFDMDKITWKSLKEPEKLQALKDVMKNTDIQVNCTCPAFQMQGHHERDASDGLAMYPYHGPRGTGVWKARHGNREGACKHLYIMINRLMDRDISLIIRKLKFN